ncbi:FIP (Fungus-Induced Protein) Related [Caenorhabditis elegans]|uniref:FIP (Fungus-Induced Protein) Related n=1 Tax=Caenorhabditis elegans TaxID=6239 RepID=Q7YX01_CAEEL|nr:FIP (Fungus-Induced Protein) Related [Caenorhabditis elegans]CAE17848.1 FIP (Fungus-Induced Protein) Related [Caenorhabditis elegans]|eukprot:NP_001023988.1 FIP (Fungus-Induced Protein) Related [Caenorhabditis elegans]
MNAKLLILIFTILTITSGQYYGGYPTASGYYGNGVYGGGYGNVGYGGYGYPGQYYGGYEYGSPYGYVGKRSSGFGPKN